MKSSNVTQTIREKSPAEVSCKRALCYTPRMDKQSHTSDWAQKARDNGHDQWLLILLDAIEPIAPIVAQGLWVAQPLAGLWGKSTALQHLAQTLETPDGVDQLRQQLSDGTGE